MLRENLAAAIASCAPYGSNTQELGRLRTVPPIVGYMVSKNPRVHRTTAMALQRLSVDPQNCITMHQVSFLVGRQKKFQANLFLLLNSSFQMLCSTNFVDICPHRKICQK